MAATIFSVSGANWLSTISTPSGPASTPMVPPCPSSMIEIAGHLRRLDLDLAEVLLGDDARGGQD